MRIDNDLINSFLSFYKNQWIKEKTLTNYKYDFTSFYRYLKENKRDTVEQVDKLCIEDYKCFLFSQKGSKKSRYWIQDSLCSGTINKKLVVIKKFLEYINYVFDIGIKSDTVKTNKVKYRQGDYFTEEEIKKIIQAIDHIEKYRINQLRFKLMVLVCYVSGARQNEMMQITIQWIENWKQKILWKNSKERYLFFNEECRKVLREYLEEQQKEIPRLKQKIKRQDNYAICSHGYSTFWKQIRKQTICDMFRRLNEYLKRDKHITLHTFRHSFATTMVDNDINPMHLKELMGHEKLNTTAGYYHKNWNLLENKQQTVFSNFCI